MTTLTDSISKPSLRKIVNDSDDDSSHSSRSSASSASSNDGDPKEINDLLDPDFDLFEDKDMPFVQKIKEEYDMDKKIIER